MALVALLSAAAGCGDGGAAGPGSGGSTGTGGAGGGGTATMLASGDPGAWAIAVDDTNVYWTSQTARAVMKVAVAGGTQGMLTTGTTAGESPFDLAIDNAGVYWSDYVNPGAVRKVPISGGAVATVAGQQVGPRSVAVDG